MTRYKDIGRTEITIDKRAQFSSSQGQRGSSLVLRSVAGQKSGREGGRDEITGPKSAPGLSTGSSSQQDCLVVEGASSSFRCFLLLFMTQLARQTQQIGKITNHIAYSRVKENEIARG